jgi:hypothetical protein
MKELRYSIVSIPVNQYYEKNIYAQIKDIHSKSTQDAIGFNSVK